jgi:hypothetical protein
MEARQVVPVPATNQAPRPVTEAVARTPPMKLAGADVRRLIHLPLRKIGAGFRQFLLSRLGAPNR